MLFWSRKGLILPCFFRVDFEYTVLLRIGRAYFRKQLALPTYHEDTVDSNTVFTFRNRANIVAICLFLASEKSRGFSHSIRHSSYYLFEASKNVYKTSEDGEDIHAQCSVETSEPLRVHIGQFLRKPYSSNCTIPLSSGKYRPHRGAHSFIIRVRVLIRNVSYHFWTLHSLIDFLVFRLHDIVTLLLRELLLFFLLTFLARSKLVSLSVIRPCI